MKVYCLDMVRLHPVCRCKVSPQLGDLSSPLSTGERWTEHNHLTSHGTHGPVFPGMKIRHSERNAPFLSELGTRGDGTPGLWTLVFPTTQEGSSGAVRKSRTNRAAMRSPKLLDPAMSKATVIPGDPSYTFIQANKRTFVKFSVSCISVTEEALT